MLLYFNENHSFGWGETYLSTLSFFYFLLICLSLFLILHQNNYSLLCFPSEICSQLLKNPSSCLLTQICHLLLVYQLNMIILICSSLCMLIYTIETESISFPFCTFIQRRKLQGQEGMNHFQARQKLVISDFCSDFVLKIFRRLWNGFKHGKMC